MKSVIRRKIPIIVGLVIFAVICVWLSVRVELVKADVLNTAIEGKLLDNLNVVLKFVLMLVCYLVLYASYFIITRTFINSIVKGLRDKLFAALLNLDGDGLSSYSEGEILSKYTAQVNELKSKLLVPMAEFFTMTLTCVFVIVAFMRLNVTLAVVSAIIFILAVFVPKLYESLVARTSKDRMHGFEKHLEDFNSYLSNMELVKNAGIELSIVRKFENSLGKFFGYDLVNWKARANSFGMGYFVTLFTKSVIFIYTGVLVFRGELSPGIFFAVVGMVESVLRPLFWMSKLYQNIISAKPVIKSIDGFLEKGKGDSHLRKMANIGKAPSVKFEGVSYAADGNSILSDASFSFEPGKKYLITGRSGAGKTTIANLLIRKLKPDSGEIYIGSSRVSELGRISDLAVISRQEAKIFNIGLRDNITLFEPITDAELKQSLESFGLTKFIEGREDFKPTELSGGEKKRISVLRAIRNKRPILILDEPLANIDPENVGKIEDIILGLEGVTLIVISHSFSEQKLERFDKIYKMEGGKLA